MSTAEPRFQRAAYTIAETMTLCGLGRDGVYKAIRSGRLPARKMGRRTLVLATDLQQFLEALPRLAATSIEAAAP